MLPELMKPAQRGSLFRKTCACEARHPTKAHTPKGLHHGKQQAKKKRDISTSFRKGPVPRPLVSTPQQQPALRGEEPLFGIPPPASVNLQATPSGPTPAQQAAIFQAEALTGLSLLAEAYRIQRATSEPVIAAAAVAAAAPPATLLTPNQDLGLPLVDPAVFGADGIEGGDNSLWADADPLASFDRVLDNLMVAPVLPQAFTSTKTANSSSSSSPSTGLGSVLSSSDLMADTRLSVPPAGIPSSSSSSRSSGAAGKARKSPTSTSKQVSSKPSKAYGQFMAAAAAAAAGPAVTAIHCETEFEREVEAAAALQQLLVLKVESSQHLVPRANDSSMRFQTHTNLPTPLNTYLMQHSDLTSSSYSSSSISSHGTADLLASMGIPLGAPAASSSSSSSTGVGSGFTSSFFGGSSSSSSSSEPFSPVHAWYRQLAAQYAHSAAQAGRPSPVRFLSLQSDSARARSVCRRLGVSSPLAVVLVDAASGRKLQEVCGAKIEQELPNGVLYFGGSDPQGVCPADQLQQLNTEAELEALKSASQLAVVAFHIQGAPPCVRSYARMYGVAQQYACSGDSSSAPSVSFGVMDVDVAPEGATVSSKLGLQGLPVYVIYQDGQEVARLSSSPERRQLGEVLAQQVASTAAAEQHSSA